MNADTIQMLYDYNYWAHHLVWKCITPLTDEQFATNTGYSWGSVHSQLVHTMSAEWMWFERIKGQSPSAMFSPEDFPTREAIRTRWDALEAEVRGYIDSLTDDALLHTFEYATTSGNRYQGNLLETLLHVVNHGTDHRAQMLAMIHHLGGKTVEQDLVFYLREKREKA